MKGKRLPLAIVTVIVLAAAAFVLAQGQWSAPPLDSSENEAQGGPSTTAGGVSAQGNTPAQPGAPVQAPAAAPEGVQAQASAASPMGAAAPGLAAEAQGAGVTALEVVSTESKALYRVRERLANVSLPIDAVGETRGVTGRVAFDENGNVISGASQITVDLTSLRSDQRNRDNFVSRNTLQTNRYPNAQFAPTEIIGLPYPLPTSGQVEITIVGDLTIRGVTRPVEWAGTAVFQPDGMRVQAETTITFDQFQITKPRTAIVLSVADEIRLETDIFFARG